MKILTSTIKPLRNRWLKIWDNIEISWIWSISPVVLFLADSDQEFVPLIVYPFLCAYSLFYLVLHLVFHKKSPYFADRKDYDHDR